MCVCVCVCVLCAHVHVHEISTVLFLRGVRRGAPRLAGQAQEIQTQKGVTLLCFASNMTDIALELGG